MLDPDRCDPSASDALYFSPLRPRWPYLLGAIAGGILGAGMLLFLFAAATGLGHEGDAAGLCGAVAVAVSGALLGIAWLGVRRDGGGGLVSALGSFALPIAPAAAVLLQDQADRRAAFALVPLALAAFCGGHAVGPGHGVLRLIAGLTAVPWIFVVVAVICGWAVPPLAVFSACWGVALIGLGLVLSFPSLRRARDWFWL
jgi:hypothetical protein